MFYYGGVYNVHCTLYIECIILVIKKHMYLNLFEWFQVYYIIWRIVLELFYVILLYLDAVWEDVFYPGFGFA